MAVTVYKSTDTGAPILTGGLGSLVNLLDKCLVTGYGSTRATATITSSGVNVSNNDTVTVDGVTYTFKTALTPAANEVLIGASAAASLVNLSAAMMDYGVRGTNYATGSTPQTNVQVTAITSTVLTMTANTGGTGGNSIALSKSAATLTVSGATFSGGAGTDTKASVGWTKPYTGTGKAAFRQAAGCGFYLNVQDNGPGAGLQKEARLVMYETMTAIDTGTGGMANLAATGYARKSSTNDPTNRVWRLYADSKTFYLCMESADVATTPLWIAFGDYYSLIKGDNFNCLLIARGAENTGTATSTVEGFSTFGHGTSLFSAAPGHWLMRNVGGMGNAVTFNKLGDQARNSSTSAQQTFLGGFTYPNPVDSGLLLHRLGIMEIGSPGTSGFIRGFLRGIWHPRHAAASFSTGDTASGSGALTGKTWEAVKETNGNTGVVFVETSDTWETSI